MIAELLGEVLGSVALGLAIGGEVVKRTRPRLHRPRGAVQLEDALRSGRSGQLSAWASSGGRPRR